MMVGGFVNAKSKCADDGENPEDSFRRKIDSERLSGQPENAMKGFRHLVVGPALRIAISKQLVIFCPFQFDGSPANLPALP